MKTAKKRICFVVQRYGERIIGGAEALCMQYVEHLKRCYDISVLTTCAVDYNTWENVYADGWTKVNGVKVFRCMTDHPRNAAALIGLTREVYDNPYHDMLTATRWLREVGPYSTKMIKFIRENRDYYDVFVFVGYHYYNSTCGMSLVPEKAIFLPTAHDEEPLRKCNYFRYLFQIPYAMLYLTEEERELVQKFFYNRRIASMVVGSGIEAPNIPNNEMDWRSKYGIDEEYIIYTGRIDESKNCDKLIRDFIYYKEIAPSDLKLLLVGQKGMDIPARQDIIYSGVIKEKEKWQLLRYAHAFVMPSQNESLSLSTLEAMAVKTPVLVCGRCEVLKQHVLKSNAGLYYNRQEEFVSALKTILSDRIMATMMGNNGKEYVDQYYNWTSVIKKLRFLIDGVCERRLYLAEECKKYEEREQW